MNCCIEMIEKATSSLQPLILMPEIRIRVHVDHKLACCQALKHPLLLSSSSALRPHPVFRASSEVHSPVPAHLLAPVHISLHRFFVVQEGFLEAFS